MIGDVSRAERIYIVCGYTDMRKAIDGLAAIVQQNLRLDVFIVHVHKRNRKLTEKELLSFDYNFIALNDHINVSLHGMPPNNENKCFYILYHTYVLLAIAKPNKISFSAL